MLANDPQFDAGPGEKICTGADKDAPAEEISEARRRVLCALLANDMLLARVHQRQLLQRTHRTPRTRAELDLTWWKGTNESSDTGPSARRGRLNGALLSSRSRRSTWR